MRFTQFFAVNGTISTSDARTKVVVGASDLGLDFVLALQPKRYRKDVAERVQIEEPTGRMLQASMPTGEIDEDGNAVFANAEVPEVQIRHVDRPGVRTHYGFLAQEVADAIAQCGADPLDCGIWTLDNPADTESRQGLRYEELFAPFAAAIQQQQRLIDQLAARITTLEDRSQ
ncbi:hypothetical protein Xmlh_17310 [Xanthomonas axonopodis pv. melhusii]|uniref:Peptidase S74 domain-containing protein n=1 Tax=Xanthomonas axonopodis pv. melhusii TaxID=487834 RepID=A0A1T1NVP7_9XANT|nr:hypothetical protein Xmlh_17310 [Xanthomonas axonopodis pv. melhusii]